MKYAVFYLILLSSSIVREAILPKFIVWNVGQGLWTTFIYENNCLHVDAGGEKLPLNRISKICSGGNSFFLSHWDTDHISGLYKIKKSPTTCASFPEQPADLSKKKQALVNKFKTCWRHPGALIAPSNAAAHSKKTGNDLSQIFIPSDGILLPGDSTSKMEKIWVNKIPHRQKIKILILGHHGSNTSTSTQLLDALPNLRVAIASARKKRFGHPHPKVVARLKAKKIPILLTEEWGNIVFEGFAVKN